jgi:hypothetical protein
VGEVTAVGIAENIVGKGEYATVGLLDALNSIK